MAPLTPHWPQPSHPTIQEVIINNEEFTSKSLSKVALPPFAVYAKLAFPPCTVAEEATYATVQMGKNSHLNLNSDLLYINHSCEPSLHKEAIVQFEDARLQYYVPSQHRDYEEEKEDERRREKRIAALTETHNEQMFDMTSMNILAGPKGLQPGDELTFFYPSTEWTMAQPFTCLCKQTSCRGTISGARDMEPSQLEGVWLNRHIRELLGQIPHQNDHQMHQNQHQNQKKHQPNRNSQRERTIRDPSADAPQGAHLHVEELIETAHLAGVRNHDASLRGEMDDRTGTSGGKSNGLDANVGPAEGMSNNRRGASSRELGGEMGGDTASV